MTSPHLPERQGGLLKVLGVAFGVAIIVGNTIGSGILRTPGDVATALPSTGWFIAIWVLGGLYALCGALTLAELAVIIPKSGGEYVFARRAFGEYAGFVIGWTDWISISAAGASIAIALGELVGQQVQSLAPMQSVIAVGATGAFVALHWLGVRTGDRTQQLLSLAKTLAFIVVAIVCFLPFRAMPAATVPLPATTMPAGMALVAALIISLQNVIYTYDGWNGAVYFSGEARDPSREVPQAMGLGVIAVLVVYLALNSATLHVLGIEGLAGEKFPVTAAVRAVLGGRAETVVGIVMMVSLLGALSALVMIASRVPYAMGEDGLLTRRASRVNAGGTPTLSLALSGVVFAIFILTGTFETVIAIASLFFVIKYCVSFSAVFALRRMHPELPRPYRAFGYPFVTAMLLIGSLGFVAGSFVTDRENSVRALYVLVASYPVYRIFRALSR